MSDQKFYVDGFIWHNDFVPEHNMYLGIEIYVGFGWEFP